MMSWTPLEIKILLHCHCRPAPYDGPESGTIVAEILAKFENLGLIDRKDYPKTTPAGEKLVQMWSDTPMPINVWIDPRERTE